MTLRLIPMALSQFFRAWNPLAALWQSQSIGEHFLHKIPSLWERLGIICQLRWHFFTFYKTYHLKYGFICIIDYVFVLLYLTIAHDVLRSVMNYRNLYLYPLTPTTHFLHVYFRSIDFAKVTGNIALVPHMETFNLSDAVSLALTVVRYAPRHAMPCHIVTSCKVTLSYDMLHIVISCHLMHSLRPLLQLPRHLTS